MVNYWEQVVFSWITGNADMHLKNFSLYSKECGIYMLTPAYDMLSTTLVMPEDTEELADFVTAMRASGLESKVIENIFNKFLRVRDKWIEFIDISFLPDEMKEGYKNIIEGKLSLLA